MRSFIILLIIMTFSLTSFAQNNLVLLKNKYLQAGFLPTVGGRMVFLAPLGAENFLLSDSALWNEPASERMIARPDAPFKPYNGFITWVGPQSAWWTKQDLIPAKKERADVWPPDPYLIYGNFSIVEKNDTLLVMEGEDSPISGVRLTKRFVLDGLHLHILVSATNIRNENVSWDLWSNARFDAFSNFRVPVTSMDDVRIQADSSARLDVMQHQLVNNHFSFLPEYPTSERKQRIAKAFVYPAEGLMVVDKTPWVLSIRFDRVERTKIHPEQALVEVYNCIAANPVFNILELEHHSAYQTLEPGQSMSLNETWSFEQVILK